MNFDLIGYARAHRYRVRNLHDGHPVPPTRAPRRRGRPRGYWGKADRMDAIIGQYGYVTYEGNERIGWCLLLGAGWTKTTKLRELVRAGAVVTQEGDSEAAGDAPLASLPKVLKVIRSYRRRKPGIGQAVGPRIAVTSAG